MECESGRERRRQILFRPEKSKSPHSAVMECESGRKRHRALTIPKDNKNPGALGSWSLSPGKMIFAMTL